MDGEVWVSPTHLALALGGGSSTEVQQEVAEGYVIVETNYRVSHCICAFSMLHLLLLLDGIFHLHLGQQSCSCSLQLLLRNLFYSHGSFGVYGQALVVYSGHVVFLLLRCSAHDMQALSNAGLMY